MFKWLGNLVDWLGLRLLVLAALGLVGFAILQPIIWDQVLEEPSPQASTDLASLIAIVVTVLALTLAGVGALAYHMVKNRLEADMDRRLDERLPEAMKQLENRAAFTLVEIPLLLSYEIWRDYERLWKQGTRQDDLLDAAIEYGEQALQRSSDVGESKADIARTACTNTLAFHLATRRNNNDKQRAMQFARQLEDDQSYRTLETAAWVYLRFSQESDDVMWNKGCEILGRVLNSADAPLEWREETRARYERAFGSVPSEVTKPAAAQG